MPLNPTETALGFLAQAPNPAVVAEMLRDLGIRGAQRDQGSCPLANYLEIETGRPHRVGSFVARGVFGDVRLPDVLKAFVAEFDRGYYPDLVG